MVPPGGVKTCKPQCALTLQSLTGILYFEPVKHVQGDRDTNTQLGMATYDKETLNANLGESKHMLHSSSPLKG